MARSAAVLSTVLRQLLQQQQPSHAARGAGRLPPRDPRGFPQLPGNGDALARELLAGSPSSAVIGGGADGNGGGQGGNVVPFGGAKFTPPPAAATGSGAVWDAGGAGDRGWGAAAVAEERDDRVF